MKCSFCACQAQHGKTIEKETLYNLLSSKCLPD